MRFRIRHADKIVGFFLVFALALVVAGLVFLGMNQRWFSRNYYFQTLFNSANNIPVGTSITMKGFEVGKIDKITLNARNTVDVNFYVYEEYHHLVTENSILELSVNPIGLGTSLLFHRGLSEQVVPEGSFVQSSDTPEGEEIMAQELAEIPAKDDTITQLLSSAVPMVENAGRTLLLLNRALEGRGKGTLQDILTNTDLALVSVGTAVNEIQDMLSGVTSEAQATIVGINGNLPQVFDQINGLVAQVSEILVSVDIMVGNLENTSIALADPTGLIPRLLDPQGDLKDLLEGKGKLWTSVNEIMESLTQAALDVQKITEGVASEVPKLSGLLLETRKAITAGQDVLEGLRNNPLLSGGISQKPLQEAAFEGMRREDF